MSSEDTKFIEIDLANLEWLGVVIERGYASEAREQVTQLGRGWLTGFEIWQNTETMRFAILFASDRDRIARGAALLLMARDMDALALAMCRAINSVPDKSFSGGWIRHVGPAAEAIVVQEIFRSSGTEGAA